LRGRVAPPDGRAFSLRCCRFSGSAAKPHVQRTESVVLGSEGHAERHMRVRALRFFICFAGFAMLCLLHAACCVLLCRVLRAAC
jgi:hypothetical protein